MEDRVTSTLSDAQVREALKKHSAERIAEVGATLKIEDAFSYEVNEERLET